MRKYLFVIVILQICSLHALTLSFRDDKDEWIKDHKDQTDTLAIPLDSSEEEEQEEINQLQKK